MPSIDWEQIRTEADLASIDPALLYDDTRFYSPSELLQLNPNLDDSEIEDAMFWAKYRRGLMFIDSSIPRQGKSTLEHLIAFKMAYYFRMLPILDTRPRTIFSELAKTRYIPFSREMLEEQGRRMEMMERGDGAVRDDGSWWVKEEPRPIAFRSEGKWTIIDPPYNANDYYTEKKAPPEAKIVTDWNEANKLIKSLSSNDGYSKIFLRNAVIGMDEFGAKYMYRRDPPNKPIKKTLLKHFDYWGHANNLWLGVGVSIDDLDRKCLDKLLWEARCMRIWDAEECEVDPEAIIIGVYISPVRYNPNRDQVELAGEPDILRVNASIPQKCLQGHAWKDIFKSDNAQGFAGG